MPIVPEFHKCLSIELMDKLYENVCPVQSINHIEGCGFMMENYFITSGHVIKEAKSPHIFIGGIKFELKSPVFIDTKEDDPLGYDLAVISYAYDM